MAVSPTHAANEEMGSGESDDDPDRMDDLVDEMMAEPLKGPPVDMSPDGSYAPPGPQVSERSLAAGSGQLAARSKSQEELESEGFYGSRRPKMLAEPYVPTEAEREEHEKSHLPWRSWCADCVGGGAVQQPHHPTPDDPVNSRLPHVLMDYFFMGQDDNKVLPMLGLKERQCKMKFAHMVEEKGPHEHAIEQVCEDIHSMGIRRMIFKTDQEPAIMASKERIIEFLGKMVEVIPEESPVDDHQANGEIGNAIRELEKQIRVLKSSV